MELNQLDYFRAIARTGNISRAAESMFVSQPAMSQTLARLENELGVKLFTRTKNRVALNPAGETALGYAQRIFGEIEAMKAALSQFTEKETVLRSGTQALSFWRHIVVRFCAANPEVEMTAVRQEQEELLPGLLRGDIDIALSAEPAEDERLVQIPFGEERMLVSVPEDNPLAGRSSVALEDLEYQQVLAYANPGIQGLRKNEIIKRKGLKIDVVTQQDHMLYREMIKTTERLFFSSTASLSDQPRLPGRKYLLVTNPEVRISYCIVYVRSNRRRLEPFLGWFEENYMDLL